MPTKHAGKHGNGAGGPDQRALLKNMPIDIEIQKVLILEGVEGIFGAYAYAHVSKPFEVDGKTVQYAIVTLWAQHGMMDIGDINPRTKTFEKWEGAFSTYDRDQNHVINEVHVPAAHVDRLKTIDEILSIEGIKVVKELTPVKKEVSRREQ